MSSTITININSDWLYNNLDPTETQYMVFENGDMRLITVFDEMGMVDKLWKPSAGPSNSLRDLHTWKVEPLFFRMVAGYYKIIPKFNIVVNVETNVLELKSAGIYFDHGFVYEIENIELDTDMSWTLDDTTTAGEGTFDWRDLHLVSNVSKNMSSINISFYNNNNEVLWLGYDENESLVWTHKHKRLSWKYGDANTTICPNILCRILECMPKNTSYGENIKFSILNSKLLMIESVDSNGNKVVGYLSPKTGGDDKSSDGLPLKN